MTQCECSMSYRLGIDQQSHETAASSGSNSISRNNSLRVDNRSRQFCSNVPRSNSSVACLLLSNRLYQLRRLKGVTSDRSQTTSKFLKTRHFSSYNEAFKAYCTFRLTQSHPVASLVTLTGWWDFALKKERASMLRLIEIGNQDDE